MLMASVPNGFTDQQIATGLNSPTSMVTAPDGRVFVAEQAGAIRVIEDDVLLDEPFATLPVTNFNDRGLLGITVDPDFSDNGNLYVYYTAATPNPHNRVSRVSSSGVETVLIDLQDIPGTNSHVGGGIHFGEDGKLYIAVGEHQSGIVAQQLDTTFGKMLRINPDGSIPTDNPFYDQTTGVNRSIWARGLRNPFTFAVQSGTGRIFINDVGSDLFEEVNEGVAGANYGWNTSEGPTNTPGETGPFYYYARTDDDCSLSGAAFYNPQSDQFPSSYVGRYLFSDYCGGWIKVLNPSNKSVATLATGIASPIDIDVADDGSVYYLARGGDNGGDNIVGRIRYAASGDAPVVSTQPKDLTVAVGSAATFSVLAAGIGPFTYQWQRNDQDIPGATSSSYKINVSELTDDGDEFRVRVTNAGGNVLSDPATLNVVDGTAPIAKIVAPAAGGTFRGGEVISYSGRGTDADDGALSATAFEWEVTLHHATHSHPFLSAFTGKRSGTFTIPAVNEIDPDIFYRVRLTVTDSTGLSSTAIRNIKPVRSEVTLTSSVKGTGLWLENRLLKAPYTFTGVAGIVREIRAETLQTIKGVSYQFTGWSDGLQQASRTLSTPTTDSTITALYRALPPAGTKGLLATYFNNRDFTGTRVDRIDPTVNFDWKLGSPSPKIGADTFSERWTGKVQTLAAGTYTFRIESTGGARLRIGDTWIINQLGAAGGTFAATVTLPAGKHTFRLEARHLSGEARIRLLWRGPGIQKLQAVPQGRLFAGI